MKKLFMLRTSKGGSVIPNLWFDDKMKAKKHRDTLGGGTVVSIGQDHKHYKASKAEK